MKLYQILTSKDAKTLYWSSGYMLVAGLVDILLANLALVELPNEITVFLGILLATISKAIHNRRKQW